ncbi:MAG: hypothetical protein ACJAWO_000660 [Halieaceae bacterium]|jgi:hypothetical protein
MGRGTSNNQRGKHLKKPILPTILYMILNSFFVSALEIRIVMWGINCFNNLGAINPPKLPPKIPNGSSV